MRKKKPCLLNFLLLILFTYLFIFNHSFSVYAATFINKDKEKQFDTLLRTYEDFAKGEQELAIIFWQTVLKDPYKVKTLNYIFSQTYPEDTQREDKKNEVYTQYVEFVQKIITELKEEFDETSATFLFLVYKNLSNINLKKEDQQNLIGSFIELSKENSLIIELKNTQNELYAVLESIQKIILETILEEKENSYKNLANDQKDVFWLTFSKEKDFVPLLQLAKENYYDINKENTNNLFAELKTYLTSKIPLLINSKSFNSLKKTYVMLKLANFKELEKVFWKAFEDSSLSPEELEKSNTQLASLWENYKTSNIKPPKPSVTDSDKTSFENVNDLGTLKEGFSVITVKNNTRNAISVSATARSPWSKSTLGETIGGYVYDLHEETIEPGKIGILKSSGPLRTYHFFHPESKITFRKSNSSSLKSINRDKEGAFPTQVTFDNNFKVSIHIGSYYPESYPQRFYESPYYSWAITIDPI